jgi:hypothetical protein
MKIERKTPYNKVLPKAGLKFFYETFVQGSTVLVLLSYCDKNPRLRQYPNRSMLIKNEIKRNE